MNRTHQEHQFSNAISSFFPEDGIDFKKISRQLRQHIRIICAFSFFTGFIAFLYTFTIQPQFQTTALIQISSQSASSNMLGKFGYKASNMTSAADTQIALMKTRYILEPVIKNNNLNIITGLNYFPIFGAWLARHYQGPDLAKPLFGLTAYAWGGEQIHVGQLIIPKNYSEESFHLIARKNNTYQLYSTQGTLILTGKVGELATTSSGLNINIDILKAHEGTEFSISKASSISMAASLSHNLKINPVMGNDPLQSTGVYQLQLMDANPNQAMQTLNALIDYTVIKNAQQKAQETQTTLAFLEKQLPDLKNNLEEAEDAINQYHAKTTTISMVIVSQSLIKQLAAVQLSLEKLKADKEDLLQMYTPMHPYVIAIVKKEGALNQQIANIKNRIQRFPKANQQEINLMRDAKIKSAMYMSLLSNQQQLQLIKGGLITDVIPLTDASPAIKIPTHKLLAIMVGFLMGLFLSILVLLIKSLLNKTIENFNQLEETLQIPIQAILPFSRKQQLLDKAHQKSFETFGSGLSTPLILAHQEPDDITIESLRSLRISLHIMAATSTHRVIALMSSGDDVGKSFIALNFAQIVADSGKRTLLIDTDLRKGKMHYTLHQTKSNGISEYLEGKCGFEDILHSINNNLFFASCGTPTRHPTQLFQSPQFIEFMNLAKQHFDQIIIDTPPIMPMTDSLLIAQHCDTKLLIVGAGKDMIGDVKQAVKKVVTHDIKINGIIFNYRKSLTLESKYSKKHTASHAEFTA